MVLFQNLWTCLGNCSWYIYKGCSESKIPQVIKIKWVVLTVLNVSNLFHWSPSVPPPPEQFPTTLIHLSHIVTSLKNSTTVGIRLLHSHLFLLLQKLLSSKHTSITSGQLNSPVHIVAAVLPRGKEIRKCKLWVTISYIYFLTAPRFCEFWDDSRKSADL